MKENKSLISRKVRMQECFFLKTRTCVSDSRWCTLLLWERIHLAVVPDSGCILVEIRYLIILLFHFVVLFVDGLLICSCWIVLIIRYCSGFLRSTPWLYGIWVWIYVHSSLHTRLEYVANICVGLNHKSEVENITVKNFQTLYIITDLWRDSSLQFFSNQICVPL